MKIAFSLTMLASLHIIVIFELELEHRQRIETHEPARLELKPRRS